MSCGGGSTVAAGATTAVVALVETVLVGAGELAVLTTDELPASAPLVPVPAVAALPESAELEFPALVESVLLVPVLDDPLSLVELLAVVELSLAALSLEVLVSVALPPDFLARRFVGL